jgi:hypothetical protein
VRLRWNGEGGSERERERGVQTSERIDTVEMADQIKRTALGLPPAWTEQPVDGAPGVPSGPRWLRALGSRRARSERGRATEGDWDSVRGETSWPAAAAACCCGRGRMRIGFRVSGKYEFVILHLYQTAPKSGHILLAS